MKTLLHFVFFKNWQRKWLSLMIACIIWLAMNHSLTTTKIIPNIPVRVVNLSPEKTIEGMQSSGHLKKHASLTIIGHKSALETLSAKDLEIVIDAKDKPHEWIASITEKNLISHNADFDPVKMISKVVPFEMIIRQSKLITEKIPITVTEPIGEAPKGYHFLGIWPYQLSMTVSGPEETVRRLKSRGLKLTFNLSDIRNDDLDEIAPEKDEIQFFIPDAWKKMALPQVSETALDIDDPLAKALRVDFVRQDYLPLDQPIPVSLFFSPKFSHLVNPQNCSLAPNEFIVKKDGIYMLNAKLQAHGVSKLFLEIVKDMMQVSVVVYPHSEREALPWSVQFLYPHALEDQYVIAAMADTEDDVPSHLQEDFLRNRFRNYMNRFRLYTPDNTKLSIKIESHGKSVMAIPQNL